MELTYDWKVLQSFFWQRRRNTKDKSPGPVFLILNSGIITAAYSDGEDLNDWIGATYEEIVAEFSHREWVVFDREKVDQWINKALGLTHFYDQIQSVRKSARPTRTPGGNHKNPTLPTETHFMLNAIETWWSKVLPSAYGVYIRLDGFTGPSLLLIIKRGRIDSFHVPDLSSMIPERRKSNADVIKFISERYLVPVQGFFPTSAEWEEWSEHPQPWNKILAALKTDHTKMVPYRRSLTWLMAVRSAFGL